MTPEQRKETENIVREAIHVVFTEKRIGDTPTDARQLTPKKYVDNETSSIVSALDTEVASVISAVDGIPSQGTQFSSIFTAGETISSLDAVVMGFAGSSITTMSSVDSAISRNLTSDNVPDGQDLWGHTFSIGERYLNKVVLPLAGGPGTWTFTLGVETRSGDLPSNSIIAITSSVFSAGTNLNFNQEFIFDPPALLGAGSYAFAISADNTSPFSTWYYTNSSGTSGNRLVQKIDGVWSSTAGGVDRAGYWMYTSASQAGSVFQTDTSKDNSLANNYIGFSKDGGTNGGTTEVAVGGIVDGFTGLEAGTIYYLSDTAGEISSVAGTQERKAGIALTDTKLLILH